MPPQTSMMENESEGSKGSNDSRDRAPRSEASVLTLRKNDEKKSFVADEKLSMGPSSLSGKPQVYLFGFDLSGCSDNLQFAICTAGVFAFNVLYGYLQELLAITIAGRKFALFLAVCQFAGYAFWAHILSRLNRPLAHKHQVPGRPVPPGKFIGLSLLRAFDLAVTNSAMQFLNYPAKTLIKSCRVVFTMLMGVVIRRKRYHIRDYVAVFTLVTGLCIFLHADSTMSAVFHPWGVLLLVISLLCDGTLNNWSEQMMDDYSLTQDEFHERLYVVSLIATVGAAHIQGELWQGIDYFLLRPGSVTEIEASDGAFHTTWSIPKKAIILIMFGTSGIMGASCLGAITKRFGALSMALTSTARKATTLFLSFALFQNNCSSEHVIGVTLFMSGLMMKSLNKKVSSSSQSSMSTLQTAGEQPKEGATRISGKQSSGIQHWFKNMFVRLPFLGKNLNQDVDARSSILRHRQSMDMELGFQTD